MTDSSCSNLPTQLEAALKQESEIDSIEQCKQVLESAQNYQNLSMLRRAFVFCYQHDLESEVTEWTGKTWKELLEEVQAQPTHSVAISHPSPSATEEKRESRKRR